MYFILQSWDIGFRPEYESYRITEALNAQILSM